MIRAAALRHPAVPDATVGRFANEKAELRTAESLSGAEAWDAALVFGGDGTVHRHLRQLSQRKVPLLVAPAGSGNDFARSLGIFSITDALAAWKAFCAGRAHVREIDLGVIRPQRGNSAGEEIMFCCVAGVGMDAEANARANRMPAWLKGRGGYLLAALASLLRFQPVLMHVSSQGKEIHGAGFFAAIGNTHRYGCGMKITPHAVPDDGLLDVCYVSRMSKLKLLCWVPAIFWGGHLRLSAAEYFQAKEVAIDAERELPIFADGDFVCSTPAEIGLIAKALRVIVPG